MKYLFNVGEQIKMPKILEYNKNNALIFIVLNKIPSPTQRKLLDIIFYFGKQHLEKMKHQNPEEYKKLEEREFKSYIIPIYIELKTLLVILEIERKNKGQLVNAIKNIEEIKYEKIDLLNQDTNSVEQLTILDKTTIEEIFKKYGDEIKTWEQDRIIVNPIIDFDNEIFKCYLSPTITKYLSKDDKYTRINVLIHTFLNSSYAINLYNILISKFKAQKEMMEKGKIPKTDLIQTGYIELEKLQDMLGMKKNHSWRIFKDFNKFILKPSIKEINESNVIEFEIVDILRKTHKRKVTALSFVLKPKETFDIPALFNEQIILTNQEELIKLKNMLKDKENKEKIQDAQDTQKIQKSPLEELKEKLKTERIKSLREFSNELQKLKNIDITNVLPNAKGKILRINEFGMLELDGEEVDNIKANAIRRILYQNPDLLGKVEEIDNELEELKDKFINKVWIFMRNGFYYAVGIKDIIREDKEKVKIIGEELLRNIKDFEVKVLINSLKNEFPKDKLSLMEEDKYLEHNSLKELEQLEEFFETNKDKFQEWLDYLEEESLNLSNYILSLQEETSEYKETAKKLEFLDKYYSIGYDLLQGEKISQIEKKQMLKKFKEWAEDK